MRRTFFCVIAALLVLTAAEAAAGHPGATRLSGVIFRSNGRPAAGVAVVLERSDGSAPVATRTDSRGEFVFKHIRGGLYDVRASSGRSASIWKHNVLVRAGRDTAIDLRLEPMRRVEVRSSNLRK